MSPEEQLRFLKLRIRAMVTQVEAEIVSVDDFIEWVRPQMAEYRRLRRVLGYGVTRQIVNS